MSCVRDARLGAAVARERPPNLPREPPVWSRDTPKGLSDSPGAARRSPGSRPSIGGAGECRSSGESP